MEKNINTEFFKEIFIIYLTSYIVLLLKSKINYLLIIVTN